MAGKRHHYLPRFLQKGFSSRQNGKEVFTWVYRKDGEPLQTNIVNVGAERHFYGNPGESSVDDDITDKELEFSPLLEELRGYPSDTTIKDKWLDEFVIHLITRTRHARLSMEEMANSFIDIFRRKISNPMELNDLILRYIRDNPRESKDVVKKGFSEKGMNNVDPRIPEFATQLASRNALQLLRSPAFLAMRLGLIHRFKLLEKHMPKIAERSHLRALSKNIVPSSMLERIRNLQWMVLVKSPDSFILGDMGPLVTKKSTGEFKALFLLEDDDVNQVLLPISGSHLVMGSKDGATDSCDVEIINAASASFSKEFFIGGQVTDSFSKHKGLIGTKSALFSDKELLEMERELMKGLSESSK